VAYATVGVLTATTFIFGGFMREQICIYMCPWPRIQSAMLDEKSLIVTYKDWRGEPRGSIKKAEKAPDKFGDCVDCNQCVAVCPTGYDIRKGPDIACITCALCIDACDSVMAQVGRPRGLIDYATLEDCKSERAGGAARPVAKALFHTRTLIYVGVWGAIGLALLFALGTRTRIDLSVQKDRNPPYTVQSSGEVRNDYTVKLRNMESRPRPMRLTIEGLPGAKMWTNAMPRESAARVLDVPMAADRVEPVRVYVVAPDGTAPQKFRFVLAARDAEGGGDQSEVRFDAPEVEAEESE
jgi:cytochrome c oxidase accessory protein FixG